MEEMVWKKRELCSQKHVHVFTVILWAQPVMSGQVVRHFGSKKKPVFLHAFMSPLLLSCTMSQYKQHCEHTWLVNLPHEETTHTCLCVIVQIRSIHSSFATYLNVLCINLLQVMGGSGRLYTCFVSCHYCPCPAFSYTVLRRNEGPLVSLKHIVTHKLDCISNFSTYQYQRLVLNAYSDFYLSLCLLWLVSDLISFFHF